MCWGEDKVGRGKWTERDQSVCHLRTNESEVGGAGSRARGGEGETALLVVLRLMNWGVSQKPRSDVGTPVTGLSMSIQKVSKPWQHTTSPRRGLRRRRV